MTSGVQVQSRTTIYSGANRRIDVVFEPDGRLAMYLVITGPEETPCKTLQEAIRVYDPDGAGGVQSA